MSAGPTDPRPVVEPTDVNWMPQSWADEFALITIAAINAGVQPEFIGGIRKAENGAHPYDAFGVLSLPIGERNTYDKQLRIACNSVAHRLSDYSAAHQAVRIYLTPNGTRRLIYTDAFIAYFANIWAPAQAINDPSHLNQNWVFDFTTAYFKLVNGR